MTHFQHVLSHALKANGSTLSHGKVELLKISPVQEAWEQLIGKDLPSDLQTTVERAVRCMTGSIRSKVAFEDESPFDDDSPFNRMSKLCCS